MTPSPSPTAPSSRDYAAAVSRYVEEVGVEARIHAALVAWALIGSACLVMGCWGFVRYRAQKEAPLAIDLELDDHVGSRHAVQPAAQDSSIDALPPYEAPPGYQSKDNQSAV